MELEDSLYPLLREVNIGWTPMTPSGTRSGRCSLALLIGAKPRGPGMECSDLLDLIEQIFQAQVRAPTPHFPLFRPVAHRLESEPFSTAPHRDLRMNSSACR